MSSSEDDNPGRSDGQPAQRDSDRPEDPMAVDDRDATTDGPSPSAHGALEVAPRSTIRDDPAPSLSSASPASTATSPPLAIPAAAPSSSPTQSMFGSLPNIATVPALLFGHLFRRGASRPQPQQPPVAAPASSSSSSAVTSASGTVRSVLRNAHAASSQAGVRHRPYHARPAVVPEDGTFTPLPPPPPSLTAEARARLEAVMAGAQRMVTRTGPQHLFPFLGGAPPLTPTMEQLQQQQEQHVQITNLAAAVARAAAAFNAHDFNAAHNAAAAGGPVDLPREPQVITVSFVIEAPIEMPEGVLFNLPLRPTQPAANAAPGAQNNTPSAGGAPSTVPTPDALPPGFPDVARITAAREEFGRRLTQLLSLGAQRGAHAPAGGGDQQPAATLLERGDVPNTLTAPAPATAQQPSQGDSFRAVLMEMIAATAEASDRVEHLNRDVAAAAATGNVDVPEQPVPAPITPPPPRPTPMSEGPHDADGVPEAGSGPWGRRIRYDRQFHSIAEAVNYIGQMIVGGGLADVATASGFLFPMHQHQRPGAAPAGVRAVEQLREVALPRVVKGRDGKVRRSLEGYWSCAVCQASNEDVNGLVEGEKADAIAWMMPCGHVFHKGCLGPWLKSANTCPTCRYEIHTDNDAYNAGVDRRMLKRKQATQAVSAKTEPLGERRVAAVAAEPPTEGAVDVGLDEDGCVIHVEEHEDGAEVMKHVEDGRMKRGKSREEVWRPYKRARISL